MIGIFNFLIIYETNNFNMYSIFCESTENKSVKYVIHSMIIKNKKRRQTAKVFYQKVENFYHKLRYYQLNERQI